jgi:Tfp pilus assembly protein PilO
MGKLKTKNMKNIAIIIISVLAVVAFGWAFNTGMEKSEKAECIQWQKEATQLKDYYITEWQYEQCSAQNININTTIK